MINKPEPKETTVAVIGAGIAGLSCATQLNAQGYQVQIFEKSYGVSGRMSTRSTENWSSDHGAQYFTARNPLFINEVRNWIDADVAAIWNPRIKVYKASQWHDHVSTENRYVGTPAMNSPGKYLARGLSIHLSQTIEHISYQNHQWILRSSESGNIQQSFDWLIIAIPAPQALKLINAVDLELEKFIASTKMLACWTVMASFTQKPNVAFDAAFINDEIISWISRNNSKPHRTGQETWTIHGNPQWSQEWVELEKAEAAKLILDATKKVGFNCDKASIAIHRWRYASGHIDQDPGFWLNQKLKLGLCSDWLNGGRVEGAWLSGHQLASQMQNIKQ